MKVIRNDSTPDAQVGAEHAPRAWWRRPSIVGMAIALALVVAAGIAVLGSIGGDTKPVENVEDVYERVGTALEDLDPDSFGNVRHSGFADIVQPTIMQDQIDILRLDPVVSDCKGSGRVVPTRIRCDLTYGEDYFYSVVAGHNVAGSVTVQVGANDTFSVIEWPFPSEIKSIERDLQGWVRENHPESESRMFGNDAYGVFSFTETAMQLHMDYLDEYLASLAAQES